MYTILFNLTEISPVDSEHAGLSNADFQGQWNQPKYLVVATGLRRLEIYPSFSSCIAGGQDRNQSHCSDKVGFTHEHLFVCIIVDLCCDLATALVCLAVGKSKAKTVRRLFQCKI